MTGRLEALVTAVLTVIAIATVLHALIVIVLLAFRRPARRDAHVALPPVTWFRPLKTGVRDLHAKLVSFVNAVPRTDQILLGADPDSEELNTARQISGFANNVQAIECRSGSAKNPKVSKLLQMTSFARHTHWIVADSEALIDAKFANSFCQEWIGSDAAVLTAGYRFAGTGNLTQRLDAMSTVLSLWPGLELIRAFGRVKFTLGACTGVRRMDVEAIGGWASLADQLAEDYWLGAKLCAKGSTVRLSDSILTLDADTMSWTEYWRHQHRVAVTYRAARPLGTAGMILTRGVTATLLLMCLQPLWGSILFSLALVSRIALAECIAAVRAFPLKPSTGLVIISDVVETLAWLRAWTARKVWWRGCWRRVGWSGRLK